MIYFGIVEDRNDPLKLGRCKVRVSGLHSPMLSDLSTDDLPWAYPIQPITSAGISGVGYAPVGLVEGSWVCVIFKDKDNQIPIILGSIGGIPTDGNKELSSYKQTNEYTVKPVFMIESYSVTILETIRLRESFRETSVYVGPDGVADVTFTDFTNLPEGSYFILGYKSKEVDGVPVFRNQSITKEKADQQLQTDIDIIFNQLKNNIRSPVTQSMIDALILVVHDMSWEEFIKTPILADINSSNYNQAAANIQASTADPKKKKRRAVDKTLFLKDDIPSSEPTGVSKEILSSLFGSNAFMNPTGKYPLYLNEPDTHKLARHEDIGSTIVAFKEAAKVKGISLANGEMFDQPTIPYNADYPFNKVFASESGHVMEFDDTPGSERIHIYHKTGSYTETDVNGTQVNRVVGDKVDILERNGTVYVRGAHNVVVEGASTLKVSGVMDVQVSGTTNISIFNDANINVSGNANVSVGESLNAKAQSIKLEADDFHVKSNGPLHLQGADVYVRGISTYLEGQVSLDVNTSGMLNMNYARSSFGVAAAPSKDAESSGLTAPDARQTPSSVSFSALNVPERTFREASVYESPDEGDSSSFVDSRISGGTLPKAEAKPVKKEDVKEETKVMPKNTIQPPVSSCDVIFGMADIPKNMQLSSKFNLLDLTAKGSRPLVNQVGLTKQQIACNLKGLCENCLDPIKEMYPNIIISSGFRRPGDVAGSSPRSQHYNGEAADLVFQGFTKKQVFDAIHEIQKKVPFDQLLLEYSGASTVWVHVSFVYSGLRKQCFTMKNHSRVSEFGKFLLL